MELNVIYFGAYMYMKIQNHMKHSNNMYLVAVYHYNYNR